MFPVNLRVARVARPAICLIGLSATIASAMQPASIHHVTHTQTLIFRPGDNPIFPCTLPRFDPALGSLFAVTTSRSTAFEGTAMVENLGWPAGPKEFELFSQTWSLDSWGGPMFGGSFLEARRHYGPVFLQTFDGMLDGVGTSGFSTSRPFANRQHYGVPPIYVPGFVGTGSLPTTFYHHGGIGFITPLWVSWGTNVRAVTTISITYSYM